MSTADRFNDGTVTDPFYADLVTVLFVAIAVVVDALNDAELYSSPKSLPRTTRVRWYPDTETPVGNQLLREYVGRSW